MNSATEAMEDAADLELKELKEKIEQTVEENKEQAKETSSPVPVPSHAVETPEVKSEEKPPEAIQPAEKQDDPMEWAKKKGFKTPEDMARALLQKEQEFHASRQKEAEKAPPPPYQNWQPTPQMGWQPPAYPSYQPPPIDPRRLASQYEMLPEDFDKVARVAADMTAAGLAKERQRFDAELATIRRSTERSNEMMSLMQDPAFKDERVQKEIHAILDSDPSIFQRERTPLVFAYREAVFNMGRRQLQQGTQPEVNPNRPPVTAGGGTGSAFITPKAPTQKEIESWDEKEIKAYINSNGKTLPKGR